MSIQPNSPLQFNSGHQMKNRFMLAPMTNQQSHEDGILSEDELYWLKKRAEGQFGGVMTCASHVQAEGKGFSGQLGIFSDAHLPGHQRIASALKAEGSLAIVQLHHAGMRSPQHLIKGAPQCPSDNEKHGAKAITTAQVEVLIHDFVKAAQRAKTAGYDGVEVHGAHGYILCQFLSAELNQRKDAYGGSFENRSRVILEILKGIRTTCGSDFLLGLRLSPERFGMQLSEIKALSQQCIDEDLIDFLDISLWDVYKMPEDAADQGKSLLDHCLELDFKSVKWTVAGKIYTAEDVQFLLDKGVDFVSIGRAAILHHDFPLKVIHDPNFKSIANPVSEAYLRKEGLGPKFIEYMKRWPGFVGEE